MFHTEFYNFIIEYSLCTYPSPKTKQSETKSMAGRNRKPIRFISALITHVLYLHSVLHYTLKFCFLCSFFMLYCIHMCICLPVYLLLAGFCIWEWNAIFSFWDYIFIYTYTYIISPSIFLQIFYSKYESHYPLVGISDVKQFVGNTGGNYY